MNYFTPIDALTVHMLEQEKLTPPAQRNCGRFGARFILVHSAQQWNDVIPVLRSFCSKTIFLSEHSHGGAMPRLPSLHEMRPVENAHGHDENILLLPLMEALRFRSPCDINREIKNFALYENVTLYEDAKSVQRIYIPLFCSQDFFLDCMQGEARFQAYLLPPVWTLPVCAQDVKVCLATVFPSTVAQAIDGFGEYCRLWEKEGVQSTSYYIQTPFADRVTHRGDEISCVFPDTKSLVQHFLPSFDATILPDALYPAIVERVSMGDSCLMHIANRMFNWQEFSIYDALQICHDFPTNTMRHILLWWAMKEWSREHNGYVAQALSKAHDKHEFTELLYALVLHDSNIHTDTLSERRKALASLPNAQPSEHVLSVLNTLPARERLRLLTDTSTVEQLLVVHTVGELLRNGESIENFRSDLRNVFPLFAAYFTPLNIAKDVDGVLQQYFSQYIMARIRNEFTEELSVQQEFFTAELQKMSYALDKRDSVLQQSTQAARWLDGLGLEWHGVLTYTAQSVNMDCQITAVRANLPTDTQTNTAHLEKARKENSLDMLGHAGDYHFPESFIKQLWAVDAFVREAIKAEYTQHDVFITGDHGATPVIFHREIHPVPEGFSVVNGRSLRRDVTEASFPPHVTVEGNYCYIRDAGRFGRGQTKGLIHGGATLEELLVPFARLSPMNITTESCTQESSPAMATPLRLLEHPTSIALAFDHTAQITLLLSHTAEHVVLEIQGRKYAPLSWTHTERDDETAQGAQCLFTITNVECGHVRCSLFVAEKLIESFILHIQGGMIVNDMGI